jgi:hypothetical protein
MPNAGSSKLSTTSHIEHNNAISLIEVWRIHPGNHGRSEGFILEDLHL